MSKQWFPGINSPMCLRLETLNGQGVNYSPGQMKGIGTELGKIALELFDWETFTIVCVLCFHKQDQHFQGK